VESRINALLVELLKWWAQPEERCGRWASAIRQQRYEVELVLRDSPSLQAQLPAWFTEAYPTAREKALEDTGLYTLPDTCPFTPAAWKRRSRADRSMDHRAEAVTCLLTWSRGEGWAPFRSRSRGWG
jgi:hypothetical protein